MILRGGSASNATGHDPALAEIIGVRLLLVNVLGPVAAGEKVTETVSGAGFTLSECRRFCSGQSIEAQQRATARQAEVATHSISIPCGLQNSIEFNKRWNLVRDQGVGGSNPLSPTNLFKRIPENLLAVVSLPTPSTSSGQALAKSARMGHPLCNGAGRNQEGWGTCDL